MITLRSLFRNNLINNVPLKLLVVKKFDIIYIGVIMLNRHKGVEVYAD